MRVYLAIILASFVVVLIQSKSLPKTNSKNRTIPSNHRLDFRPKPVPVNGKTNITTRHQPTTRTKRSIDKNCRVMDLILVIDSSGGVQAENWVKVLQFAKNIVSRFNLGPHTVRIGAVTYSSNVEISIQLNNNGNDVIDVLPNIAYQGYNTNTQAGLEIMRAEFRTSARPNVRQVGVLIISGQTMLPNEAIMQAKMARTEGIELYVTGITHNFDYQEALEMVEDPQHIQQIEKFDDLVSPTFNYGLSMVEQICGEIHNSSPTTIPTTTTTTPLPTISSTTYSAEEITNSSPTTTTSTDTTTTTTPLPPISRTTYSAEEIKNSSPTTTTRLPTTTLLPPISRTTYSAEENCDAMDMILVLSSNEAVDPKDWFKVLQLAKDIVSRFNLSPDAVRIGVITYSNNPKISIPLGDNGNDVINDLDNIDYQGGAIYTDAAFEVMRAQFITYARRNVRRIGVLITNQYSNKPDKTIEEARLAREEGIELYVIGISDRFGYQDEVLPMVEDPHHILKIEELDDLVSPMYNYGLSTEKLICGERAHAMPSNTGGSFEKTWSCDFESGNICDMIQDQDKDQFDWTVHTGPTPSDPTGPLAAYSGLYYAYIEASDPRKSDDSAILYFPKFNAERSLCVRFAYNMYGMGIRSLQLMKITPTRAMVPLWLQAGDQGTDWLTESVLVQLGLGDQLLFLAKRGDNFAGDIAIDDVKITGGACT